MNPPTEGSETLRAARQAAARGWNVFPLHPIIAGKCGCGVEGCGAAGKHPAVPHWQDSITTPREVDRYWARSHRPRGIGLACGKASGVWALDIDVRGGGMKEIKKLQAKYRDIPVTTMARTGSGGRHLLFAWPEGPTIRNSAGAVARGVDVRGEGGFIVLPPSPHVSGEVYAWILPPDKFPPVPAPAWIVNRALERKSLPEPSSATLSPVEALKAPPAPPVTVPAGQRHAALVSLLGLMRSWGAGLEVLDAAAVAFFEHQCEQPVELEHAHQTARDIASRYSERP